MRKYPALKSVCFVLCLFVFSLIGKTQTRSKEYPIIGKSCPDFTLYNVDYYPNKEVILKNLKGKWIVLDFWTKSCVVCVQSFPKINQLQKQFKDSIQFILIGKNDEKYSKGIQKMYERFRAKQNLNLAIAYDTLLFDQFGVQTTPHIVIIDPNGIVKAVTGSSELNKENIEALLKGEDVSFKKKENVFEEEMAGETNTNKKGTIGALTADEMEDSSLLYRSVLTRWNRDQPISIATEMSQQVDRGYYQTTCMSLKRLYNIAYLGVTDWSFEDSLYTILWKYPILELTDSSLFNNDFNQSNGLYNYSIKVPKQMATEKYLQWSIQCDLKKYFGYNVSIEIRKMPYWKLVAIDSSYQRLKSKGKPQNNEGDHAGIRLTNGLVRSLIYIIWGYHQHEPPFIDETGITENIDITIDAMMTDINDIKKALQKNGLDLVKGEKEMKVIVIRDSKN